MQCICVNQIINNKIDEFKALRNYSKEKNTAKRIDCFVTEFDWISERIFVTVFICRKILSEEKYGEQMTIEISVIFSFSVTQLIDIGNQNVKKIMDVCYRIGHIQCE